MSDCCCEKKTVRDETKKKALCNRLNRIEGQINGIKKMVNEDRYCQDILIQLAAVEKSIKSLANQILNDHVHNCIARGIEEGNTEIVEEISDLFKMF